MITSSKYFIVASLACVSLANISLCAEEDFSESNVTIQEHVSVRSRNTESQKSEDEKTTQEQTNQEETHATLKRVHYQLVNHSSDFMLAPSTVSSYEIQRTSFAFPISCHWLKSVSDTGMTIELEDASHWELSPSDIYVVNGWRKDDNLVITPNQSWFTSYDYYITNKSNNTFVKANLRIGPLAFLGPYSHWIVDIDYMGGHVYLENKMVWCIDPKDGYNLKNWAVNDHIILGVNDSWFSHYNHILINVDMDEFLKARQY